MTTKTTPGLRLRSLSWAELGVRFRAAKLAGNEALAARMRQAIEIKKEIASSRRR